MIEKRYPSRHFELVSKYQPAGDQPEAITQLVDCVIKGKKAQILLGRNRNRENLYDFEFDRESK